MTSDDSTSTYAPKSPDLSSFYSGGPTQPASQLHSPDQGSGQYKLHPPPYAYSSSYAPPVPLQFSPVPQQHIPADVSAYASPSRQQPCPLTLGSHLFPARHVDDWPPLPFQHQQSRSSQDPSSPIKPEKTRPQGLQPAYSLESPSTSAQPEPEPEPDMPPRRAAAAPPAPVIEPSPVKTKFPTARIKRIMQADEEVGKVAQQTPIAVGKALELFMVQLVSQGAELAREKGSRRVTASMLKQVVETDDQWDFLRDIVNRVETDREGGKPKAKAESDSDDDSEPKKRSRVSGRKRKT